MPSSSANTTASSGKPVPLSPRRRHFLLASSSTAQRSSATSMPTVEDRLVALIESGQRDIKTELQRQNLVLSEIPLIKQDVANVKEEVAGLKRRPIQTWQVLAGIIGVLLYLCSLGISVAGLLVTVLYDIAHWPH